MTTTIILMVVSGSKFTRVNEVQCILLLDDFKRLLLLHPKSSRTAGGRTWW
jgi:hypothetical protein